MRIQVVLADVLGRVDPEAGHAVADQLVQVGRERVLYLGGLGAQVGQADQLALGDLQVVVEVVDVAARDEGQSPAC